MAYTRVSIRPPGMLGRLAGVYHPSDDRNKGFFRKGNRYSCKENLTEEANARRFAGLVKTWKNRQRRAAKGEARSPVIPKHRYASNHARNKFMSKAVRARVKVARQAREIQEQARKIAEDGLKRMEKIITNPLSPDSVAVAATDLILNRAYGKPLQTNTNVNYDANGKPEEVSDAELNERIKLALERIESITGRTQQAAPRKKRPADLRKLDRNTHGPGERLN